MIALKNLQYFIIIIIFLVAIGCMTGPLHIPESGYSRQINRVYHASFSKTWESVLEVLKLANGSIITEDKDSGIISYSVYDEKSKSPVYINVYIEERPNKEKTIVYFFPRVTRGVYLKEIDRDFFEQLNKRMEGE